MDFTLVDSTWRTTIAKFKVTYFLTRLDFIINLDLNYRDVTISSPNPGLAFMLMANEAQLAQLEKEIASKDNFSETIAKAIGRHF